MPHHPLLCLLLSTLLMPVTVLADTLYLSGEILTMNGDRPHYVEALVERDGRIIYAGDVSAARAAAGDKPIIVDLQGHTMMPGFIDTHVHYPELALTSLFHNLRPWDVENLDAFVDHVKSLAEKTPEGDWIRVFGFESALIEPYRPLTRQDLDRATTRHPVVVLYQGFHWASMNSAGLLAAGITRETSDRISGGGIYFKDNAGEPTGVATESAVVGFLHPAIKGIGADELAQSMFRLGGLFSSQGVTAVADLATGASGGLADLEALKRLAHNADYPLRITATPLYQLLEELNGPVPWDGKFQAHRLKLLVDASLIGGTSATVAPQLSGSTGNLNYHPEEFQRALRTAMEQGYSLAVHTMGDRAHKVLLDSFEGLEKEYSAAGFNHSIEHSALLDPADIARVKTLGLSVSHLIPFLYYYGDAMREVVYGEKMAADLFNAASLLDEGVNVALHSDAPVFESRPLEFVWVAVNRKTSGGVSMEPRHAIGAYDALQGVTINAARHVGLDADLGSLAAGKYADLVILQRNPLEVPTDQIRDIEIVATIKGGKLFYGALP